MNLRVSGHGNTDAQIMLIGDVCGDSDLQSGLALSGDSKRILTKILQSVRMSYEELWKTALVKDRGNLATPDINRVLVTQEYKDVLLNEINSIKPRIVVPLSELSFEFLTGLTGIRKFRGSVLPPNGIAIERDHTRIIPVLGPNPYLYEDPKLEFISRLDFTKVSNNLYKDGPIAEVGLCWVCRDSTRLREYFERHYATTIAKPMELGGFVVFDIETFANLPTCISFCFDGFESVCIPLLDFTVPLDQRMLMLRLVLKLLESPIPKVNQNIKFDWRKLYRFGFSVSNVSGDTMLAASCLYAEFPKNLGFLTSIYTDMPYFKDESGKDFDPTRHNRDRVYLYNAKDSLATHIIHTQQLAELTESGTAPVYKNLITILPIYKEMEDNGLLVDDYQRRKLLAAYESLYDIHCTKLCRLVGRSINPLSSVVCQKLVYDELGFKKIRGIKHSKKSGKPSADEDSLELLMWGSEGNSDYGKLILRSILDCRKIHKCIEFLVIPTYPDGRHRCEFNLAGTETGRTTAGETTDYYLTVDKGKVKLKNLGHSFQTIGKHGFTVDGNTYGKNLRSIFVPTPGYVFVECDLAQAEARVDAVLAKDYEIIPVFDSPTGIHRLTGSWVYGCDPSEVKKNDLWMNPDTGVGEERYHIAKQVRHACERNMREDRMMLMVKQPLSRCVTILKVVHEKQPNIRQVFHHDIRETLRATRCLVAPNGRRRDFYGKIDEHAVNEGISFLPQAIVTDYLKQSLRKTIDECREIVRPISEAHDGFFAEVRRDHEKRYAETYKRNIEVPIDFRKCSLSRDYELTIPCEAEWSDTNWQELRKLGI